MSEKKQLLPENPASLRPISSSNRDTKHNSHLKDSREVTPAVLVRDESSFMSADWSVENASLSPSKALQRWKAIKYKIQRGFFRNTSAIKPLITLQSIYDTIEKIWTICNQIGEDGADTSKDFSRKVFNLTNYSHGYSVRREK